MVFSVINVVGILSESKRPKKYWSDLKKAKKEGNQTSENIGRLKMHSSDDKMRLTDVAESEQIINYFLKTLF